MEEKIIDNLISKEESSKRKKKIVLIIGIIVFVIVLITIILILTLLTKKDKTDTGSYKPSTIETFKLPNDIIYKDGGIFSKSGKILLAYNKENDNSTYIAVVNEDGSNFKVLWNDTWKPIYQSNGIRLMPFDDNKRILTGDFILECSPNIDECQSSKLIPVIYPKEVINLNGVYFLWSEIIISPDNEHIGWTTLSSVYDDVNFIARLNRNEENYTMTNVQIISTLGLLEFEDKKNRILKGVIIKGGEIKQFINGGEAITLAGAGKSGLAKSIFQDLMSDNIYAITQFPGYEETTIISPDGKLGLTMTTRFSPKTSSEILGYMPRPFSSYTICQMNRYTYLYGVGKVRESRKGNIGPAVINIEESLKNPDYLGYDLHSEDEDWVYLSPMSWHPNSKKAMFSEVSKSGKKRIRIVNFNEYNPSKIIEKKTTPDNIKYAKTLDSLKEPLDTETYGYFKGKEGNILFNKTSTQYRTEYNNYTEDGEIFYNGYEQFNYIGNPNPQITGKLISNVTMTGKKEGKMDLMITMNMNGDIVYEDQGQKVTYGYVKYNGKELTIENSYDK